MFKNWLGKKDAVSGDDPSAGNQSIDGSISNIQHFDHTFKCEIQTIEGPGEYLIQVFGSGHFQNREAKVICSSNTFEICEDTIKKTSRAQIQYRDITGVTWDHANSEVKLTFRIQDDGNSFIILHLPSSVEFERELKLRFTVASGNHSNFKVPSPMYVGMFAGSSKPKPFQRKRPNISYLASGKLPPLQDMRTRALELRKGSYKPCPSGESRRIKLANQHIYEGCNTFKLLAVKGKGEIANLWGTESLLLVQEDKLIFKPHGPHGSNVEFSFDDIDTWSAIDNDFYRANDSGIEIVSNAGDKVFFGVKFVRDIKHTVEYFWNKYQTLNGKPPIPGSTHGRPILTVSTLIGDVPSPELPQSNSEVVDIDGTLVRPGERMALRTSSVAVLKGMMGAVEEPRIIPQHNHTVAKHWSKVVLHQGWLLKQGGIGVGSAKSWIKRYFVLYRTSQGHFLSYYADFTECPLFSTERGQRNIVDLAKATFIRPGSNLEASDIPLHSFDIVTTEREWTLCAETKENLQKWLKVITHAVDEDVAILPDEELVFKVKPKVDPSGSLSSQDYSTSLKVSAHGVSVTIPDPANSSLEKEVFFWVFTDFYKWSLLSQEGKLALLVNVFIDSTFSRRHEFIFRHKEAARLATAIEYFIEKFMSVMHIYLETTTPDDGSNTYSKESPALAQAAAHEFIEDEIKNAPELDLLGLDDDLMNASISAPQKSVILSNDPFGDDPFADPAPIQSKATASKGDAFYAKDPFGDDPFSTPGLPASPKVVQVQIPTLPPLSPAQLQQQKDWWLAATLNNGGHFMMIPSYKSRLKYNFGVEIRGSQGRVTLFYRNNSETQVTSFKVTLEDPRSSLRYELGALASELNSHAQVQQTIMLEAIAAVYPGASLSLEYVSIAGGVQSKRVASLALPLSLVSFDEALPLGGPDFLLRWNALQAAGQEASESFPAPQVTPKIAHGILTGALKYSYVEGVVDTSVGVAGAATLRLGPTTLGGEKVNVGCLLKIEIAQGHVRVTVRVTLPAAAQPIVETAKALLLVAR